MTETATEKWPDRYDKRAKAEWTDSTRDRTDTLRKLEWLNDRLVSDYRVLVAVRTFEKNATEYRDRVQDFMQAYGTQYERMFGAATYWEEKARELREEGLLPEAST